ncbi:hypothetical protein [Oceanobacillus massiliensis]|uniref:hypothetical protein n=1 Tax=Oceanobacillus massiliensis TaxID=1465765 RepID=UPI000288B08C|nr:hypothetical protein [Oceanobacillus massiliensis]
MRNDDKKSPKKENTKWNEEERTKLDSFDNQKFADDIPMEDLKIEMKDEKKKTKTKDESQSERKYKADPD